MRGATERPQRPLIRPSGAETPDQTMDARAVSDTNWSDHNSESYGHFGSGVSSVPGWSLVSRNDVH